MTMQADTGAERLRGVVALTLGVDVHEVTEQASPASLPSWTSLAHLNLMAAVEEAFAVTFTMKEMTSVTDFARLRALLELHRGHAAF